MTTFVPYEEPGKAVTRTNAGTAIRSLMGTDNYLQFLYKLITAYEDKTTVSLKVLRKIICDCYNERTPIALTHREYESLCSVCDIFLDALNGGSNEDLAQGSD